jgi:hypothetical protein
MLTDASSAPSALALGSSARRRVASSLVLLLGASASAYLYRTDPHEPGHVLPACPFRLLTGWLCPACGGTRMAYDLMHRDVGRAWHDNALLLVLTPWLLWLLTRWVVTSWRGRPYRVTLPPYGAALVLLVALVWGVVRNTLLPVPL